MDIPMLVSSEAGKFRPEAPRKKKKFVNTAASPKRLCIRELGPNYQDNVLRLLIQNHQFCVRLAGYLEPERHFESPSRQWLARIILDYYGVYGAPPQIEDVQALLQSENTQIQNSDGVFHEAMNFAQSSLGEVVKNEPFVMDYVEAWLTTIELQRYTLEAYKALDRGDLQSAVNAFSGGSNLHMNFGLHAVSYVDTAETAAKARKEIAKQAIPTGFPVDADFRFHGVPRRNVGVILAGTNVGKTAASVAMGACGVHNGYKVAHISLETDLDELRDRYDTALHHIEQSELIAREDELIRRTNDLGERFGNCLMYEKFEPGELNEQKVQAWLNYCISLGFRPDIVIIDSADDMVPMTGFTSDTSLDGDRVYRGLMRLSSKNNVVLWTTAQGNREALSADVVDLHMVGRSIGKVQRAAVVLALCQNEDEAAFTPPRGRIYIAKNRFGRKKRTYPVVYDWAFQRIVSLMGDY